MTDTCESPSSSCSSSCPPLLTPTDSGPDGIEMFDMDGSDMSMSDAQAQQNYDPRRQSFSEEELKPQPMIKKARKILVPDNMKVRNGHSGTAFIVLQRRNRMSEQLKMLSLLLTNQITTCLEQREVLVCSYFFGLWDFKHPVLLSYRASWSNSLEEACKK